LYTYNTWLSALAAAIEDVNFSVSDPDFLAVIPTIIDIAEQRIYRELDLVEASVAVSGSMVANNRYVSIPTSSGGHAIHITVLDQLSTFDGSGVRCPAVPVSRDVIDYFFPIDTAPSSDSIPTKFARVDDVRILVGPPPGSAWVAEFVGSIRPDPLSNSNPTTYLSQYLPDLFFAATMVAACGTKLKNFGAMADDPRQAVAWESVYQRHLASALAEEQRKKYTSIISSPAK
jgi:hypothetical protein